jgi:hypothetical protein
MRFVAATILSVATASMLEVDPCIQLCAREPECRVDTHWSYCKVDHEPQTCFAFYFNSPAKTDGIFYHVEGDVRSEETPITCAEAAAMIEDLDYCTLLCTIDPACMASGRGSWRKIENDPVTCHAYIINEADPRGFSYWVGEGDDRVPMTPVQAREFYEALRA